MQKIVKKNLIKEGDDKLNTLVLEETEMGDVPMDVYQKLANDRILFICNTLTDEMATDIVATILLKDAEDPDRKITLFINSEGGNIRNAFMIYDTMQMVSSPIETVCIGEACDEAAIILMGGTKGMRLATKNSVITVSQLFHDWMTHADLKDAKKLLEQSTVDNKRIMEILSKSSGKSIKQVIKDFDRRVFLSPKQAIKYGFIDKEVKHAK